MVHADQYISTMETHTTKDGLDAPAPLPDKPFGGMGCFTLLNGSDYLWLTPPLLETVVHYYEDVYLNGYYQHVNNITTYIDALDHYQNIPIEYEMPFAQLRGELQTILDKLYFNVDYYGNPAGWVPMLSFESNLLIYKNEIRDSIQTLYLAHRVLNAFSKRLECKALLQSTISQVTKDMEKATQMYHKAIDALPRLTQDMNNLAILMETCGNHLKQIESELLEKAKHNIQEEHAIRSTLKIFSGILQLIPVGQPALCTIGSGLNLLSNANIHQPLDTIGQLSTLFAKYADANLMVATKQVREVIDNVTAKDKDKDQSSDNFKKLIYVAKNLESSLKDISEAIKTFSAPADQIQKELNRLESENDEYITLTTQINTINEQKIHLVQKLTDINQQIRTSLTTIQSSLLQLDTLHRQISLATQSIDHSLVLYVKKIQRSSLARLVKYQYYLVKAYHYRLLKTCPTVDYQIRYVFDSMTKLLDSTDDGQLNEKQFNALMDLYQTPIREMAENIISEYNAQGPQLTTEYTVPLNHQQLDELNNHNKVTINLMTMGYCDFNQQNVLITDLNTDKLEINDHEIDETHPPTIINLMYTHSGWSTIRSDGKLYNFRPKTDDNVMRWGTTYNLNKPLDHRITHICPAPSNQSLLSALIDPTIKGAEILTHYYPSAWNNIIITKDVLPLGSKAHISQLQLSFDFNFFPVNTSEITLIIKSQQVFAPTVLIDQVDLNDQKDGMGNFLRIYEKNTLLKLFAPTEQGLYIFSHWTNITDGSTYTQNDLQIKLEDHTILELNYNHK